jgi:ribonuclease P protein component
MDLSFSKKQKLKSQKLIEKLFAEGHSVSVFPLRMIYLQTGKSNQVGVSVSKKNFKNAVDRNRIKRLLREAYRHNKKMLIDNNVSGYAFMILYIGKDLPDYKLLNSKSQVLLTKFLDSLSGFSK